MLQIGVYSDHRSCTVVDRIIGLRWRRCAFCFCCFLGSTTYVFCLRTRTGPNLHCGMQCVFDWAFPKGKLNRLFRSWSRVCGKPCLQSRAQYVDRLWRLWLETLWWTLLGAIANRYTMRDILRLDDRCLKRLNLEPNSDDILVHMVNGHLLHSTVTGYVLHLLYIQKLSIHAC